MIPNIHQSIDEIIKGANSAEKILWQQARLICGENSAIRQLYYQGNIAGSEFVTFSANKFYIGLNIYFDGLLNANTSQGSVYFYDPNNVVNLTLSNSRPVWQATAAAIFFDSPCVVIENIMFSRLSAMGRYTTMKFIGYRLTR